MSANPTHYKGRRPSAELAFANIVFIFDFTIIFNNFISIYITSKTNQKTNKKLSKRDFWNSIPKNGVIFGI